LNLYVLFAIALGAISGLSEPQAAPRAFAQVVNVRGARPGQRQIAAVRVATSRIGRRSVAWPAVLSFSRAEAPLTGSASPRAPAH
jgi:hypothetical protein